MFIKKRKMGAIFFVLVCLIISLALAAVLIAYTLVSSRSLQNILSNNQGNKTTDENPIFSETQEQVFKDYGIAPSALPTEFSPAQMDCITKALGEDRTREIFEQKLPPQSNELLLASPCLSI